MAKKKKVITSLACEECKERNYSQIVSGKRSAGSLRLSKYCSRCRKHMAHKETK
jgi:large subunit ribosomal protein L33